MAAGEEAALRLEGFADSLRGCRVAIVGKTQKGMARALRGRLALLDAEVAHRGRKMLLVGGATMPKWLQGQGFHWDSVFLVRDATDLRMAATVLQHTTKPVRAVWAGAEPVPAAFLGVVGRTEGATLLSVGERAPVGGDWQAIFWTSDALVEDAEPAVVARMGAVRAAALRPVIKELRAADVGLVWSSIGESDKAGDLYWYDPGEGGDLGPPLELGEAAETLRAVAEYLTSGRGR
jgi:hypothetical protein